MKNMKKLFSSLLLITLSFNCFSQRFEWVSFVGPASASGIALARDAQGNLYSMGAFSQPMIVNGNMVNPFYAGSDDIYLVKFDSQGNILWIKPFGGTWYDSPFDLAVDFQGNVYAAVTVQYAVNQFEDTTVTNVNENQLIKFDTDGNFVWSYFMPNTNRCAVSDGKHIYVAESQQTIKKLDEFGNLIWARSPSFSSFYVFVTNLAVTSDGDILASGIFAGTLAYQDDTVSESANGSGESQFYMKLDSNGNVKWLRAYGRFGDTYYTSIPIVSDNDGDIYVGVEYGTSVPFGTDTLFHQNGQSEGALLKMDADGFPLWSRTFSSSSTEVNALFINENNEIYLGGEYNGTGSFPDGVSLPATFNGDNFVAKFSSTGTCLYAKGSGMPGATDRIGDLTGNGSGTYYLSAWNFGGDPAFGCITYDEDAGLAVAAFTDSSDAPTVPSISSDGTTLSATPDFSYGIQWFLDGSPIPGATSQTYTPSSSGQYMVVYTNQYGCAASDTFNIVGIAPVKEVTEMNIYPNPVSTQATVEYYLSEATEVEITVTDLVGKEVSALLSAHQGPGLHQVQLNADKLSSGIYFCTLSCINGKRAIKVNVVK